MKKALEISKNVLIFFNLVLLILVLLFAQNTQNTQNTQNSTIQDYCLENIYNSSDTALYQRGDTSFYRISLIPEIKNFNCLSIKVNPQQQDSQFNEYYITSPNLFRYLIFLSCFSTVFLYLYFENRNKKLFYFLIVANFIIFHYLFFSKFFIDENFFVMSYSIAFLYLVKKNSHKNFAHFFIFINGLLLIYNYTVFSNFLIWSFLIYIFNKKKLLFNHNENVLIIFTLINFYFLKLISGLFEYFNSLWISSSYYTYANLNKYSDLKYVFDVINCKQKPYCKDINNYGPILEFLRFDINGVFFTKLFASFSIVVLIYIFIYIGKNLRDQHFLLFLLFVSPPIIFGITRMNFDLHVAILIFVSIKLYKKNKALSYICLLILTQFKIYPIFVVFGFLIYFYIKKEKIDFVYSFLFLTINSVLLIYYFFSVNFEQRIQNQAQIDLSFGIREVATNLENYFNVDLISSIIIIILLFVILNKAHQRFRYLNFEYNFQEFVFGVLFICIAVFSNFDFRLTSLIILLISLLSKKLIDKNQIYIITMFLLTSTSNMHKVYIEYQYDIWRYVYSSIQIITNELLFFLTFITIFKSLKSNFLFDKKLF